MSTQDGSGIPFEIRNDQQNFRLLELPPPLLELITSKHLHNFTLRSVASGLSDGSASAPANVVLCTDSQTYQVRQVQSSNSVFILQPSESRKPPEDDSIPPVSLSAIAQCVATLELIPATPSPIAFLTETLPIYSGPEAIAGCDLAPITNTIPPEHRARQAICGDAPFSPTEFDTAWKNLCAFEFDNRAYLPTALSLAGVWRSMISAATLRNVDLEDSFFPNTLRGAIEEDGHPSALFGAIMARLGSEKLDLMDGYAILDAGKTVPWVGSVLLEAQTASTDAISLSDFMQDWRNHLPENWRTRTNMDVLKGKYSQPSKDKIVFDGGVIEASDFTGPNDSVNAKSSGKGARKWHEKFKNARH